MANLLSIREFTRRYYGYSRLYSLMASLRVCAEKDPRVKEQVEKIAEGTTLYLTTFPARRVLMCKKQGGKLRFLFKKYAGFEQDAYVMFKSIDLALPVYDGFVSFTKAFNESRLVIKGDTQIGMQFVALFDIAQATLAPKIQREKYLTAKPYSEKMANDVKFLSFFRGWL